jgi:hypothetical protein
MTLVDIAKDLDLLAEVAGAGDHHDIAEKIRSVIDDIEIQLGADE